MTRCSQSRRASQNVVSENYYIFCDLEFYYTNRKMKSQILLLQTILLLISVSCSQAHVVHKEVCEPRPSRVSVKVVGCEERTVDLNTCAGTCLSEESFQGNVCWCCKPVKKASRLVDVLCKSGDTVYKHKQVMYEHEECSCSRCFT